jgi:hypothetical protein
MGRHLSGFGMAIQGMTIQGVSGRLERSYLIQPGHHCMPGLWIDRYELRVQGCGCFENNPKAFANTAQDERPPA